MKSKFYLRCFLHHSSKLIYHQNTSCSGSFFISSTSCNLSSRWSIKVYLQNQHSSKARIGTNIVGGHVGYWNLQFYIAVGETLWSKRYVEIDDTYVVWCGVMELFRPLNWLQQTTKKADILSPFSKMGLDIKFKMGLEIHS